MANLIKTVFGFDFNKNSVTNVTNAVFKIKDSIISVGPVFQKFQKDLKDLANVTYWVGVGTAAEKAFDLIGALYEPR